MTECILLSGNTPAELDHLHEIDANTVHKIFGFEDNKIRLGRIGTIGDGSCFFHSCCLAMNLHDYASLQAPGRKEIAYKLRSDMSDSLTPSEFEKLGKSSQYEEFKDEIRQPKTWADEKMIKWASKYLNANIVFINLSNNKNQLFCGVVNDSFLEAVKKCATRKSEIPTILIGWIDHSHFECIVRIDSVNDHSVNTTSMFVPSNKKDLETTIIPMMLAYVTKCSA
jgi:hypothetical protein